MSVSVADSRIYGMLLGDPELAAIMGEDAALHAMIRFEIALAGAQARLGTMPEAVAARIAETLETVSIAPEDLRQPTLAAGLPIPAFVATLRAAVGDEAGGYVHFGATSQDVLDTALVLQLREALGVIGARLDALITTLAAAARREAGTLMAARTRTQLATPTTLGLRIAGWLGPLVRCRRRLVELRPRLLVLQLGGASGTQSALGQDGPRLMAEMAAILGLGTPPKPWHTERDGIAELGSWLSLITGACGRIGADLVLLGRSEIGELRAGAGGGSSTMPQKANPVAAETLVSLARLTAGQLGTLHQALVHTEERDGAAWAIEWAVLPPMTVAAGAALRHARSLAGALRPDPVAMRATIDATGGAMLAEAFAFALARHMPLPDAQAAVKRALATGRPLAEAMAETGAPIDWEALADPARHTGAAAALVERACADAEDALREP